MKRLRSVLSSRLARSHPRWKWTMSRRASRQHLLGDIPSWMCNLQASRRQRSVGRLGPLATQHEPFAPERCVHATSFLRNWTELARDLPTQTRRTLNGRRYTADPNLKSSTTKKGRSKTGLYMESIRVISRENQPTPGYDSVAEAFEPLWPQFDGYVLGSP